MGSYKGISKKKMKDGSTSIMVRFNFQGITYPVKNFTKLYGITTEKDADIKLGSIKLMLSEGKNPFATTKNTLNEIWDDKIEKNKKNGDWTYQTIRNYTYFFNKHLRPTIGKKKLEKIKYEEVKDIIDAFGKNQGSSKNTVIDILKPIFREEFNKGNLIFNIMDKFTKIRYASKKEPLAKRTIATHEEVARRLYEAIPLYNEELALKKNVEQHKMFLYMVLMTAHRTGEIIQLEKEHCHLDTNMIIAPREITKTNESYRYPIPDECLEYIKNHKGGKLFNIPKGGTTDRLFRRLVNLAEIETIANYNVSAHDTRKLLITIMINKLGIDSRIADYCLDHTQKGVISHYMELNYDVKVEAYHKYWEFIRGKISIKEKEEQDNTQSPGESNINFLEKLVGMLEKGYLTKEEFEIEKKKLYSIENK